jgi:DNA helicase-2/ATP-dependent DNA helicase PcrA
MIAMTGGARKPIEAVRPGEEVVTYNSKKSYFPGVNAQGRKILKVSSRPYSGDMITVKTSSTEHRCTPNHKCLVRFDQDRSKHYFLYLMTQGSRCRVGLARMKYWSSFGPAFRARSEEADRMWILDVFSSESEARVAETCTSLKYGIPQTIFKNCGQATPSQANIDAIFAKVGNDLSQAVRCLESFGRKYEFPFWTREKQERFGHKKQSYIGSRKSFITHACNLISGAMQVRTFDGTPRGGAWETASVSSSREDCVVYSLEVEHTEDGKKLYISDGVVTHNSIFMFRGADANAFPNVQKMMSESANGGVQKELPVNYRCGKAIIDYVNENTHVKDLVAGAEHDGVVTEGTGYDDASDALAREWSSGGDKLAQQTAFIARTNKPLVDAALDLLMNNMDFEIIGRDFSQELVQVIERVTGRGRRARHFPVDEFPARLSRYVADLENKWRGRISKADELNELKDVSDSLSNVVEYLGSMGYRDDRLGMRVDNTEDLIDYLRRRFSGVNVDTVQGASQHARKDPRSSVTLTTAHRSKGLEFDRVFVLEPDLFPHPRAKSEEELGQERNAWYVALTRAIRELHVLAPKPKEARASAWVLRNCRMG